MQKKILNLPIKIFLSSYAFVRSMLANPHSTGMICPSSKYLCEAIADNIPQHVIETLQKEQQEHDRTQKQGYIIEFGAGTGNVTQALLNKNIPPSRLIVFEYSESFADYLKKKYPYLRIIQDDAANLEQYLPHDAYVACIVSSIPFVSLPKELSINIIETMKRVIDKNCIIQYTYALFKKTLLEEQGLKIQKRQVVWKNVPPACIQVYTK